MTDTDQAGNIFTELENIRVTYVDQENRSESKNWANCDVIRIQAKRDDTSNRLHLGAEIPISSPISVLDLINALVDVYKAKLESEI